tara:strand:+ start:253 stop:1095 length:843 start_codon:yes stop_codon:yes gene_type:complete
MNKGSKPTFICVGPGRTGTTWLFNFLQNHKGAYVVPGKEINYFNDLYHKDFDWYLSFFNVEHPCKGEISNTYFLLESTINKIANDLPGIKLIFCLRDPKTLAKSIYDFAIRRGIIFQSFDQFLNYPYIKIMGSSGISYSQDELRITVKQSLDLKIFLNFIENKNFDIFIFEYKELKNNQNHLIKELCSFLEIEPENNKNNKKVINKSGTPRFKTIMPFLSPVIYFLKIIGLRNFVSFLKTSPLLNNFLFKSARKSSQISQEDLSSLDELQQNYFKMIKSL